MECKALDFHYNAHLSWIQWLSAIHPRSPWRYWCPNLRSWAHSDMDSTISSVELPCSNSKAPTACLLDIWKEVCAMLSCLSLPWHQSRASRCSSFSLPRLSLLCMCSRTHSWTCDFSLCTFLFGFEWFRSSYRDFDPFRLLKSNLDLLQRAQTHWHRWFQNLEFLLG